MLQVSKRGEDLIKSFEGCKLVAYPDPGTGGDPWTIGWGTTGPDIKKGLVWTQEQADKRFTAHIAEFAEKVWKALDGAAVTQNQFDAMVSLMYNIGPTNFKNSTLLKMHKAGNYVGAAGQFIRWNKAAGKVMKGLTRRREAEAKLYAEV